MVEVVIKPYGALPCHCETFTINGKNADVDDFGYMEDLSTENRPDYGCGDESFIPYNFEKEEHNSLLQYIKTEYGIDECDIYEIQEQLKTKLHVGYCSWCS